MANHRLLRLGSWAKFHHCHPLVAAQLDGNSLETYSAANEHDRVLVDRSLNTTNIDFSRFRIDRNLVQFDTEVHRSLVESGMRRDRNDPVLG